MYDTTNLNPDALTAEVAYRRSLLTNVRSIPPAPRGRWWKRTTRHGH